MYADGGARGNPGPAAGAAVLFRKTPEGTLERCAEAAQYFRHATNNVAEYTGIIVGLRAALELGARTVEVRADSQLAVRQLTGVYKIRNPDLQILAREVRTLVAQFLQVQFHHVPREQNVDADALVNATIDRGR